LKESVQDFCLLLDNNLTAESTDMTCFNLSYYCACPKPILSTIINFCLLRCIVWDHM